MRPRANIISSLLPTLTLMVACGPSSPDHAAPNPLTNARTTTLVDTLVQDNAVWTDRDPQLLATKYERMGKDIYDYMRGSAGLYVADASQPGSLFHQSTFLKEAGAWEVMIAGDPHPENIGSFLGDTLPLPGEAPLRYPHLELNDLDGAGYGPYLLDVRRANLGLLTLADALPGLEPSFNRDLATALSRAYAEEILRGAQGDDIMSPHAIAAGGKIAEALLEEALDDGLERKRLNKHSIVDDTGARRLKREPIDDKGRGALELERGEWEEVQSLMSGMEGLRLLDGVRRFGTGVQSLPARRYLLLVDGGDDSLEDDHLLNVREVVDPPAPLRPPPSDCTFESNADRLAETTLNLWYQPDADPEFLTLVTNGSSFKVLSWDSYYQSFDHDDLREDWEDGKISKEDLTELAEGMGRLLAGAHGRALSATGSPSLDAIARDITYGLSQDTSPQGIDAFTQEQSAVAVLELNSLKADYALFREALEDLGPLLGAETLFELPN